MNAKVRLATTDDAAAVADIYGHYVVHSPATFEEVVPSTAEMAQRIDDVLLQFPFFVAVIDDTVAGYAYASPYAVRASYRWSTTVGIYLHHEQRRKGLGRALYAELLPAVRRQGYVRAYAGITMPNEASIGLHEAIGFYPVGTYSAVGYKLGDWRDVGWWEYQLQLALPERPAEPIPFPALPR
jgi:phosphinothricin acetyltransferase